MNDKRKLVIISDTPMWRDIHGVINVYEPTLREIEYVANIFDEVIWLGFNRPNYKYGNGRPTEKSNIKFKLLVASGGHTIIDSLRSIFLLPYYFSVILYYINTSTYIHTRGPSVPALISILCSFFLQKKTYWNKYAGNWGAEKAPFFYKLQKKLVLKATFSRVTINGMWDDQKQHILSFDNPCFSACELEIAGQTVSTKNFEMPFIFCFAGRLEPAKGVGNLLEALNLFTDSTKIQSFFLAGDGELKEYFMSISDSSQIELNFVGSLRREELNLVYAKSHFIVLPSLSEGFPKVLSEAAAFGCIPIATDISALSQYIKHGKTGFLMSDNTPQTIYKIIIEAIQCADLKDISLKAREMIRRFTYEEFVKRLRLEIFSIKMEIE